MKNLFSKIKILTLFGGALVFSQEIKAQNPADSLNKNFPDFFKAGIGFQYWNKIEPYKNFNYFYLEVENRLAKTINLEGGFDYGSQKQKIENKEYNLAKLEISLGLNKYFLTSDKRKFSFYVCGGAMYVLMSETQINGENTALGFYYGGGIENTINSNTKIFLSAGINKSKIKTNSGKLNIGGSFLEFGIKINPPIQIRDKIGNEDPLDKTLEHYKSR